jgi:RES domain-containing protein
MTPISGRFYRIIFASDLPNILEGVRSHEGRFHHDGERTIYVSPSPEAAAVAVNIYLKPGDPPRLIVPLKLTTASILDFRTPETEKALGLNWRETAVPWAQQRAAGLPATSWRASDAARVAGAGGMIYQSRTLPSRWWHLVLFHWNSPNTPQLVRDGPPSAFIPQQ